MTFGQRLQELRRRAGLSQDTLAERLEVSRQAVSKWERDEAMPETDKVVRIAQLFDISLDSLLLGKDEPVRQTPPQPRYAEQPRYTRPTFSQQFDQFLRRYGTKAGTAMTAVGAVICALCLLAYFLWPVLAGGFLGAPLNAFENIVSSPSFDISPDYGYSWSDGSVTEEIYTDIEDIPDWVWDAMEDELVSTGEESYFVPDFGIGGLMDSALDSMDSVMQTALRAQASLFLIGLLPGLLLLACGLFLIIRSKKLNTDFLR